MGSSTCRPGGSSSRCGTSSTRRSSGRSRFPPAATRVWTSISTPGNKDMQKRASLAVLALALMLVGAFLFRREPKEQKPPRPAPRAVSVASPELPTPAAPLPVKPAPIAPPAPSAPPPVQGPPGTLRGTVKIRGELAPRKRVRLDVDPNCEKMHPGVMLSDSLVTDANGN